MIRIKAKYGYNSNTINQFQEEIIRQMQDWTGFKLDPIPKWIYNPWSNSLKKDPNGKKVSVLLSPDAPCKPKLSIGPLDRFLK